MHCLHSQFGRRQENGRERAQQITETWGKHSALSRGISQDKHSWLIRPVGVSVNGNGRM